NPRVKTYVLSAYDAVTEGVSGNLRKFTDPAFLASRRKDIVNSYRDLALALYRNYRGTGKVFIVSTWETENALYCGKAYSFAINQTTVPPVGPSYKFRDHCLANYQ